MDQRYFIGVIGHSEQMQHSLPLGVVDVEGNEDGSIVSAMETPGTLRFGAAEMEKLAEVLSETKHPWPLPATPYA